MLLASHSLHHLPFELRSRFGITLISNSSMDAFQVYHKVCMASLTFTSDRELTSRSVMVVTRITYGGTEARSPSVHLSLYYLRGQIPES